jgi:hypothetical protein
MHELEYVSRGERKKEKEEGGRKERGRSQKNLKKGKERDKT